MALERSVGVVGLGALGSLFAGLMARAGIPVVGACRWQAHRDAILSSGLLLQDGESDERVRFPVAEELPRDQSYRLIIILVKSFDTESAAHSLAGRLEPNIPVLTLQNGLGNAESLEVHLDSSQILAGTTTYGALREEPGRVRLTGRGECEIGAWTPAGERLLPSVLELLQQAGISCRMTSPVKKAL